MAYVDDWHATPLDERKRLQQFCGFAGCGHQRYLHGDTITTGSGSFRTVEHTAGKCGRCRCQVFNESPITKDEVLDIHEGLEHVTRLADIGIGPLMCQQVITRWNGLTSTEHVCLLENDHGGEHVS